MMNDEILFSGDDLPLQTDDELLFTLTLDAADPRPSPPVQAPSSLVGEPETSWAALATILLAWGEL